MMFLFPQVWLVLGLMVGGFWLLPSSDRERVVFWLASPGYALLHSWEFLLKMGRASVNEAQG